MAPTAAKKKGRGGGARADAEAAQPEPDRDFYLLQIRDLEQRLARYQQRWDEVQASEDVLRLENEQMAMDNKEIVAFLKRTLNQRADEIAELHDQMLGLQQAKDAEKEAFEAQLAQVRHEFQETKDQLTSENMLLSGKLAALEEFRVQKDELMARFATLEEQLQKQEEGHKEYTYNLERKMVLDRDRLKKEMVQRVNVVASEFRKVSHSQMAETTKRAIRENVAISVQLTKLSDRSYDLLQENEQLKEAQVEMQKQLEMLEHNEKEMAKNSLSHQKMIWMLIRRCKEQKLLLNEYTKQREAMCHLEVAHKELQGESQALRERLQELEEEATRRVAEGQSQARLLEEEQKQRKKAKRVLARVVHVLKELLLEKPVDEEEGEFDVIFQLRRKEKLQSLLALVQQAVQGEQRLPEQEFPPLRVASREHQLERSSQLPLALHVKASRVLSHHSIMWQGHVPQLCHSMPNMSQLGLLPETTYFRTLRAYSSNPEQLVTSWPEETQGKQPTTLPKVVAKSS
ncbi:cilia- and flagella-associated protein 157 [Alligator mississippiensis]|uniref:Cilia- and flagella-associated protein 157 n=1 Tax=Alligator mississippiensis TaxID=8496 RepID=A0A151MFC7_ALLMI|nr:cilia- and flagella-associated protein 157 [Alligator mississippiensis]KYO23221.1 hypothetical protein Y1Q_0005643 [Alligator mississippiensis]